MIPPRFIRIGQAPAYLGMDRRTFDREVRPYLTVVRVSTQGLAVDRLDLDEIAEVYLRTRAEPPARPLSDLEGTPCRDDTPASTGSRMEAGGSTSASEESGAFSAAVRRATSRRRTAGPSRSSKQPGEKLKAAARAE